MLITRLRLETLETSIFAVIFQFEKHHQFLQQFF